MKVLEFLGRATDEFYASLIVIVLIIALIIMILAPHITNTLIGIQFVDVDGVECISYTRKLYCEVQK